MYMRQKKKTQQNLQLLDILACKSANTVNQLNLTALKFSILQMWTYLVQEYLVFFRELSNGI